jgi:Ca-activated chloride channel family protein
MSRRLTPVASVATALALLAALGAEEQVPGRSQTGSFRASIDLVSLNVTVSNAARQYVGDLGRDDFVVLENGLPQNVTFFAKTSVPLALALLLDSSASMEQAMATAQEAAVGFARSLGRADMATVIDFDTRVETAQAFTSDIRALEGAIRRTTPGGSTAMFNAIYIALKELSKVAPADEDQVLRRRAMIVLSDGDDTSSLVSFDEVLDAASRSDTVIYTIGLGAGQTTTLRSGAQEGAFVLRRLAEQTGGRAFFPKEAKDLAGVYADIREELSSQYSLAYESGGVRKDGEWRQISVRVNRPNLNVRTRRGYFAARK